MVGRQNLLLDSALQRGLDSEGFVQIPLLDQAAVGNLRLIHRRFHPDDGSGLDVDFAYVAPERKRRIAAEIEAEVRSALERHSGPLRMFNFTFVTKWPGTASDLAVHQDWSYVDEHQNECWTVWVPLDDVSSALKNGALGHHPKSHLLPVGRRGANSRPWYLPYRDEIAERLAFPAVQAGNALAFFCRTLHGSPTNESDVVRRAITFMVAKPKTPLRYYHMRAGFCEEYEISEALFSDNGPIDLRLGQPVGGRLFSTEKAVAPRAPLDELRRECGLQFERVMGEPEPAWELPGSPLGEAEVAFNGPGGLALRQLHRRIRRHAKGPILDAQNFPPLNSVKSIAPGLARAWKECVAETRTAATSGTGSPEWDALDLFDAVPEYSLLADMVRTCLDPIDAWILTAGPRSSLAKSAPGSITTGVVILPLSLNQPSGSVVFQAGDEIEALHPNKVLAFDPSFQTAGWNFGSTSVVLLVASLARRLSSVDSLLRRGVEALGALPRYWPSGLPAE